MADRIPDRSEKDTLRAEMRRRRAAVASEERLAAAAAIDGLVLSLPEVAGAGTVLLFYSFGSEVPTAGMVERLLAGGHRVLLPFVLIFMILLINKKELMGEWANSRWFNLVSWIAVVVIIGLTLAYVGITLRGTR